MRLGISSHAFAWAIGVPGFPQPSHPLTAVQLVERAAALGVSVVQIADNLPLHRLRSTDVDSLVELARARQIDIELGTAGIAPDQLREYLRLAQRVGSPILRTLLDAGGVEPTWDEALSRIREVIPEFEQAGVCLAIENHDRFSAAELARLVVEAHSRAVGICLDTANSFGCGEGLETVVERLGPHVVNLHIKDFRARRLPHHKGFIIEGAPAGRGQINIPWLLERLRPAGRTYNAIIETWVPPEPQVDDTVAKEGEWAASSVQMMRRWIAA